MSGDVRMGLYDRDHFVTINARVNEFGLTYGKGCAPPLSGGRQRDEHRSADYQQRHQRRPP